MRFYGQSETVANRILSAFKAGDIPAAMARVFISRKDSRPCTAWSWSNQMLTALAGYDDARGFRQWEAVGRHVRKGERAFHILIPLVSKRRETDESGSETERAYVYGFKSAAVFGYEQTDGEPIAEREAERAFIDALPLIDVARAWGIRVQTYNGRPGRMHGFYRHDGHIALGVENVTTWAHELIHAADHRRQGELKGGQHLDQEVVAQFGASILLEALGRPDQSDRGFTWRYIAGYAEKHNVQPLRICERMLRRACEAVALILDTADALKREPAADAGERADAADANQPADALPAAAAAGKAVAA